MDFGMWITVIAFGLFYLRLALLRSQKKREIREQALAVKRQGKGAKMTVDEEHLPGYKVTNWVIIVVAVALMLVGMMSRQNANFPALMHQYWYVGTALGAIIFAFGFK